VSLGPVVVLLVLVVRWPEPCFPSPELVVV
jgi:hypothetical protein